MKNILSKTKTAIILLIAIILLTGSYVYLLTRPIAYGMKYRTETVYEGQVFEGVLKYSPDGKITIKNTSFDEPMTFYYYYKDGYVFTLVATNEEEYEAAVAEINADFEEALAMPFYASKINAFKLVAEGEDGYVTTYTCAGAIVFAVIGGIDRLLLIALTVYSFVLSKKAKNNNKV